MRRVRLHCIAVWAVIGAIGDASAEGDNRPQDRFYFGFHSGIANYADSIADMPGITDPASAFALEDSFWPNDYLGFGWGYDVATLTGAVNTGLGSYAVIAVPLRYVQPYAGLWAGIRHRAFAASEDTDVLFHPLVGLNGYVSRNTRLFVQVQGVRIDDDTGERAQVITLGVRWSPDVFHRFRGADKFNAVWLTTITSVAAFLITRWTIGPDSGDTM